MKKAAVPVIIVVLVIGAIFYFRGMGSDRVGVKDLNAITQNQASPSPSTSGTQASSPSPSSTPQSSGTKLADTQYMQFAYLISGDNTTFDAATTNALAGFQVIKEKQADGSMKITLKALKSEYHTQVYTVMPGQKLYFIETSLGDDRDNQEYSYGDDTAVLVDANGYIITN